MALGGYRDEQGGIALAQALERDFELVVEVVQELDALGALRIAESFEQAF
jgi:hypothetical protein